MDFKEKFEDKYGSNFTIAKCNDKGCSLKDVSSKDYLILDGDKIKKEDEKSADCIIIDLRKKRIKLELFYVN